VTAGACARARWQVAPRTRLRLEPPVQGGALAILDHAGGDRRRELWLRDRAYEPAQTLHRHTAIGGDLGERDGPEPRLELIGGQAQGVCDAGVEGTAHTPHADCSGSAGGGHTGDSHSLMSEWC
jgi:hypothetical protein